jgi:signal transduction histidine kinase
MESGAGSLTGVLPFSRLKRAQWDVLVGEPTELIAIHRERFPDMIRDCPVLTESLVHSMLDRARGFAAANWQDEKVLALGRLAAGLAHELNNPAAAAASGAERLARALSDVGFAAHAVGAANLTPDQQAVVAGLVTGCQRSDRTVERDPVRRADLEDEMSSWLTDQGLDADIASTLVEGGVRVETLKPLPKHLGVETLPAVMQWVAATAAAAVTAGEVERATRRIDALVRAVRSYTYMDRPPVRESVDVAASLAATIDVVSAEARARNVTLRLDVPAGLPPVLAVGPDLNQAWSNLLHNALDAVSAGSEIVVSAMADGGSILVRVIDDGVGIDPEVAPRVFDPFFTTKPTGSGVGLGLDIVRRVAKAHGGDVDFESAPGRTEFRMRLPLASRG